MGVGAGLGVGVAAGVGVARGVAGVAGAPVASATGTGGAWERICQAVRSPIALDAQKTHAATISRMPV